MREDRLGDKARLEHILFAIEEIYQYTQDKHFEEFVDNSMMLNATIRQLEIIGEAANRLSRGILQANTDIEWEKIIGLRNLLIHEYFGVTPMIIWEIIQYDVPVFEEKIRKILTHQP